MNYKFTYSTNMMGPMNHWYEKHNVPFTWEHFTFDGKDDKIKSYDYHAGGRIDIHCEEPWQELGTPIMTGEDWDNLSYFCDEFSSETQLNEDEFFTAFEKWLGREMNLGPGEKRSSYIKDSAITIDGINEEIEFLKGVKDG